MSNKAATDYPQDPCVHFYVGNVEKWKQPDGKLGDTPPPGWNSVDKNAPAKAQSLPVVQPIPEAFETMMERIRKAAPEKQDNAKPAPDPTMAFLKRLDDEALWEIVRSVPIFRANKRLKTDGTPMVTTEADLGTIVANMRQAEQASGVPLRITLGHTNPKLPQTQQPPICGFGRNARLGTFGPAKVPAVLVDMYYRREDWDEAKTYPYRSAEYYPMAKQITGVALLKTDPQLDLGMLAFGGLASPRVGPVEGGAAEVTIGERDAAVTLAGRESIGFDDALAKIRRRA